MKKHAYGNLDAEILLIQMVGDHDLKGLESELQQIRKLTNTEICLYAFQVENWNRDLSLWKAPAVFGNEDFLGEADRTLKELLDELKNEKRKRIYIGGYSLAGLFALWAVYQTDLFRGAACASPSMWFPGFIEFMESHPLQTNLIYLSLGDREHRTRNPIMASVADRIQEADAILKRAEKMHILEWNKGNHFNQPDLRCAKAFAWLINQDKKKIMVSACLLGENCKYNGGNNRNADLVQWLEGYDVISICPEVMGGLPIPRTPSEIREGIVVTEKGESVDTQFRMGALRCLEIAQKENPDLIILQSRSPSCGVKQIYDGSFRKKLIQGSGITAKLLKENGFTVVDIEDMK